MTTTTAPIQQIPAAWLAVVAVMAVALLVGYALDRIARRAVDRHVTAALDTEPDLRDLDVNHAAAVIALADFFAEWEVLVEQEREEQR